MLERMPKNGERVQLTQDIGEAFPVVYTGTVLGFDESGEFAVIWWDSTPVVTGYYALEDSDTDKWEWAE